MESPLFIPVPWQVGQLSHGREGEADRAWCAPVGAAVTTLGVHQTAYILRALAADGRSLQYDFTTDCRRWSSGADRLFFVWEALVSRAAHSRENHPIEDAVTALDEFVRRGDDLAAANAVSAEPRFSLVHAAALWAGWVRDNSLLSAETIVLMPAAASRAMYRTPALSQQPV